MRKVLLFITSVFLSVGSYAHVGSSGVTFEGSAGRYKILANITPPDVIPGVALVTIYLENNAKDVTIAANPVFWLSGSEGAPPAEAAVPSRAAPGQYEVKIWMMTSGASGIQLTIKGPLGKGSVVIPMMAIATAKRNMPAGLGWVLAIMAIFLMVLMATIIGSSVSDGLLSPGDQLSAKLKKRRRNGFIATLVILGVILWGGGTWWNGVAEEYQQSVYQPLQAKTTIHKGMLSLVIDTVSLQKTGARQFNPSRKMSYLVPDHGKLMHLFLVRSGELDVFAHLHPQRLDALTFVSPVPELPPGKYWVYADITRLSGFAETIVDTLNITATASVTTAARLPLYKDDAFFTTNPIHGNSNMPASTRPSVMCGSRGIEAKLPDGSSAVWIQKPGEIISAGKLTMLNFEILDKNRKPVVPEPYLGMAAHAVILKDDGSVYIHLHPAGSFSMGSQKALLDRIAFHQPLKDYLPRPEVFADSISRLVSRLDDMDETKRNKILMAGMDHPSKSRSHHMQEISFPYTFPQPGRYRIFIQTKQKGKIISTAFDALAE